MTLFYKIKPPQATEHPHLDAEALAPIVPGTSEQRLQGLLTSIDWDEQDLNRQRVETMTRLPSEGDGVLIFDDTGCAKQGKYSVGVARQYSGTLGKTGNCHYAERTIAWPVATRWSNFGEDVPLERLVEYAHRRHWVEQDHEEAKGLLGWDEYQGRLWTGFHRHAVCVMLASSFLVWQEGKQRQDGPIPKKWR